MSPDSQRLRASTRSISFPRHVLDLIGLGYLATQFTFGQRLEGAAVTMVAIAIALPLVLYGGWRNRYRIERGVVNALTPVIRSIAHILPGVTSPEPTAINRRIEDFFTNIERIATNPQQLLLALGFSAAGWVLLATSLWLSLLALGYAVPPAAVLVAIPVAAVAGLTPLPGGLGAVEAVLIAILVALLGHTVGQATVAAAVVIHRAATFWIPTAIGGGTVAVVFNR